MSLLAAAQCVGGNVGTLDWNTRDWPDPVNPTNASGDYAPTLVHTETNVGGIDMTFAFSSDSTNANFIRSLENYADANGAAGVDTVNDDSTIVSPSTTEEGLAVIVNPTDTAGNQIDMDVFLDVTFSETISAMEVTISDIDASGTREDVITVIGSYMGATVLPVLSVMPVTTATLTIAGNVATSIPGAGNRSPTLNPEDATLIVNFNEPIDSYQVIYSDNLEDGVNIGGLRGTSMANQFEVCRAFDVSGTVFQDSDGDGVFSGGDTALVGVTVEIFADDGAGNPTGPALDSQVTDANGDYTFTDLAPESYVIVETDPSGYASLADSVGANDNQIPITVANADIIDRDFLDSPSADLSVTKDDSSLTYTPGTSFTYTLVVSNNGPGDSGGAIIVDNPLAWAQGLTWTCGNETGGAVCPNASGSGSLSETITTFPSGGTLTYTLSGTFSTDMDDYIVP
jgi:hypothetical protein